MNIHPSITLRPRCRNSLKFLPSSEEIEEIIFDLAEQTTAEVEVSCREYYASNQHVFAER